VGRLPHAPHQLARIDRQRSAEQEDNREGWLTKAALKQRRRGAIKIGELGKTLLR
jgi:hypothetical protein